MKDRALELLDDALERMRSRSVRQRARNIHEVRKRLKETRALILLLASGARAKWISRLLRDVGRELSPAREADSAVETFNRLRLRRRIEAKAYEQMRQCLVSACSAVDLRPLRARVAAAREEIARWPAADIRFDRVLRRGYRSARNRMERALRTHNVDDLHEWRKKTKQQWYHSAFVPELEPRRASLHALSRALGTHHDLMVFRDAIARQADALDANACAIAVAAANTRAAKLEEQVIALGTSLFSEPPRLWVCSFQAATETPLTSDSTH